MSEVKVIRGAGFFCVCYKITSDEGGWAQRKNRMHGRVLGAQESGR